MQEFASRWIKQTRLSLPKHLRDRAVTVFAPTSTGDKALVCRFVRPQPPPDPDLLPNDAKRLLRFVSLIPYIDDAAMGARLDVWNTTASFLDLCAGDAEEHALLLCNLFLALRKEAYVILGHELPEGETAYVMTRGDEGHALRLWNAHTGRVYSKDDPTSPLSACPLCSVGCIFNERNVWANIQKAERPFEVLLMLACCQHHQCAVSPCAPALRRPFPPRALVCCYTARLEHLRPKVLEAVLWRSRLPTAAHAGVRAGRDLAIQEDIRGVPLRSRAGGAHCSEDPSSPVVLIPLIELCPTHAM